MKHPELRFKDKNWQEFPEWNSCLLGDIASFSKGKGISKSDVSPDGKTRCILYWELYTTYGQAINVVASRTNLNIGKLVLSEDNDVIIPASGETHLDIATAAYVADSGIALGGDLNIIRSSVDGKFMAFYLSWKKRQQIAALAQGNAVVHLSSKQLRRLEVEIPSNSEQEKIAAFLSAIDAKIANSHAQLEALKRYKRGLLQQLFA